jgi:hypothetical protein
MFTSLNKTSLRILSVRWLMIPALLAFVVGLLAIGPGCSSSVKPDGDRFFCFDGSVVDKSTLASIDSAKIETWLSGQEYRTRFADSLGAFSFCFLTGGKTLKNLRVAVSKSGYVPFDTLMLEVQDRIKGWDIRLQKIQKSEVRDSQYEKELSEGRSGPTLVRPIASSESRVALPENNSQQLAGVE